MNLSIIIPVYNEATQINELLFHLYNALKFPKNTEIIIVDGGSTDKTLESINQSINLELKILQSNKGRGRQMNAGAKASKNNILYFLHADSYPPKNFDGLIYNEIKKSHLAGCFKMKFDSKHWWLKLAGWFTQFNLKFFRGGDQSLFITKELFNRVNGFEEKHPIFEDFTLIRKLYQLKQFTVIQKWITSSSRRYTENGITRLQYHYWILYLKKWNGVPTKNLVTYYKKNIK